MIAEVAADARGASWGDDGTIVFVRLAAGGALLG